MAHFLDAGSLCGGLTPKYERLGKDLEEYNIELNPDTETSKNILGETTFKHNGYEASSEADPFYAETDSDLFKALQKIVDERLKDDNPQNQKRWKYTSGQKRLAERTKHTSRNATLSRPPTVVILPVIRSSSLSTMLASVKGTFNPTTKAIHCSRISGVRRTTHGRNETHSRHRCG